MPWFGASSWSYSSIILWGNVALSPQHLLLEKLFTSCFSHFESSENEMSKPTGLMSNTSADKLRACPC